MINTFHRKVLAVKKNILNKKLSLYLFISDSVIYNNPF